MFTSPQILKPMMLAESALGHLRLVQDSEITDLLLQGVTHRLEEALPKGIIHFPYGEPEAMLAEVALTDLQVQNGSFLGNLLVRSNELTGAAQFLKLYPDKELSRYVARGGLRPSDDGTSAPDKVQRMEQRSIGAVLSKVVADANRDIGRAAAMTESTSTYQEWLERIMQVIGRRPIVSERVTTSSAVIANRFNRLGALKSGAEWEQQLVKAIVAMYYMHFSQKEEDLVYKSDFSSSMFTRFVTVRLRDYAAFYASLFSIKRLLEIRMKEETTKALLRILGDSSDIPQTTVADLQTSLRCALNGERVRNASQFSGMIDNAIDSFKKAHATEYILRLDDKTASILAPFTSDAPWMQSMGLNPSYVDVKIGPAWERKRLSDEEISTIRKAALENLRSALRDANVLASFLPPLEQGSNLFDGGPQVSFSFPATSEPRFLSVADGGTYAVGVAAISVDENGILHDELLPHMGVLFNYTAYVEARAHFLVSRLYEGNPGDVGLPTPLNLLPVPINFLEGEKAIPVYLSLRDISTDGCDYLRELEATFMSSTLETIPFMLAQLAAAFTLLVTDRTKRRMAKLVELALKDLKKEDRVRVPSLRFTPVGNSQWLAVSLCATEPEFFDKQYTYGLPTQEIFAVNEPTALSLSRAIIHPDETVSVALLPHTVIPRAKQSECEFVYVLADLHKLVPVMRMIAPSQTEMWQKAHFCSMKYPSHGQYWGAVKRVPLEQPLVTIQQPAVLVGYRPNYVGYLDENALVATPSPWKAPTPVITQELPAPAPAEEIMPTPEMAAPKGEEEKL